MAKTFFISDMHFNHANIIKYCNRPFSNVEEMNETIISNWNKTVSNEDTIYVLGDVGLFVPLSQEIVRNLIDKLNGKKYLICGNHDRRKKPRWWVETGFLKVTNQPIVFENKFILSHEPVPNSKYINIHGHVHHRSLNSKSHINVCVECINYTPILLEELYKG